MKKDSDKSKAQLIQELDLLRQRIAQLEAEQESSSYYDDLNIGIINVDIKGNFTYVNKKFLEISGYSTEEIIGKNGLKLGLFPSDSLKLLIKRMADRLSGKPAGHLDLQFKCKDGRLIWVELAGRLLKKYGVPIGFQLNARDITDRKKAEEALRESEQKYRNVVERASDGICIIQDKLVKYANSQLAEIRGGAIEEIINTPFISHVHPDAIPMVADYYNRRMAGEQVPPIYETVLRRKDGSKVNAELNVGIIEYQGKPAELAIIRDITERKRIEIKLRDAETRYRTLFEQSPDGVLIVNSETTEVLTFNNAACKMLGYSRDEFTGIKIADFEALETPEMAKKHIAEIHHLGHAEFATKHRTKQGEIKDIMIVAKPIDIAGKIFHLSILRDITDSKKAEEALRYREEFIRTIATMSAEFINLPLAEVDAGINRALKTIGEFCGVGHSYVFLFSSDGTRAYKAHEWRIEWIEPQIISPLELPTKKSKLLESVAHGEVVHILDVADLPAEFSYDKEFLKSQGIQSVINIPLMIKGTTIGFIGLNAAGSSKTWTRPAGPPP